MTTLISPSGRFGEQVFKLSAFAEKEEVAKMATKSLEDQDDKNGVVMLLFYSDGYKIYDNDDVVVVRRSRFSIRNKDIRYVDVPLIF